MSDLPVDQADFSAYDCLMAIIENPVTLPDTIPGGGVIRQFTVHYPDGFTNGEVYDLAGAREEKSLADHAFSMGNTESEGAYIMETMIKVICSVVE